MILLRRFKFVVYLLVAGGCERSRTPPPTDTAAASQKAAADSARAASPAHNWDPSAGAVLLVAGETPSRAFILVPDSATADSALAALPRPGSVTLFGRGGTVQNADLPGVTQNDVCAVGTLVAAPPPRPWSVGFLGGIVTPIAMDSLMSLGRADSADAVVTVTRLASAIPNDSAGRFDGLPFVVRSVWRFTIAGGPQIVIGVLTRQINQEATPLQENTLVLAERAAGDSVLTTAYSERSYGDEETIESREVLAALMFGSSHPTLVIAHDFGTSMSYGIVERGDDGRWRARWMSARRHC